MDSVTITKKEVYTQFVPNQFKTSLEKYPTYKSVKEDRQRRPTGAQVVFVHPGPTIEGKKNRGWLYGDLSAAGSSHPPQGICSLAAILKENGYKATVYDAEPLGLGADEVAEMAMSHHPKYVGVSSYTISIKVAARIAKRCKEIAAERGTTVTTMVGGPHITTLPKPTMDRYREFDYGIPGEGEITTVELIDALENKQSVENIPNLVFMQGDEPKRTVNRSSLLDLDELPMPEWGLLPKLSKYYHPAGDNLLRLPSCAMITSRGCPGKCYFCNPRGLGAKFRRHSAGYIIKMMKYLQKNFGIKDVFIADDMFVFDRENVFELCRLLKADRQLDMTWSVFARVDYVDKELLAEMKSAKCWQVGYGLESGSEKVLKEINKQQTVEQMENAIRWAHEVGLAVRGMFMVGSFGETKETLEETIAFVKRNPISDFHITFFTPMPGTGSFVKWPQWGTWKVDTTEGSTSSQHTPTFVVNGLSVDMLVDYQKRLYRAFIKPSTVLYHAKKIFRPSLTRFMLRGGIAFLKYTLFQQSHASQPSTRPDH